jgi:hypothetical protein
MTITQAIDLFEVLLDKYGVPHLENDETCSLLNMAARGEFLNRLFPDSIGGIVNFDFDQNTVASIQPLIWPLTVNMGVTGVLTNAAINTALQTATGEAEDTYFRIASVGWTTGSNTIPVKFIKQNDLWSFERNVFKKPSATNPKFTLIGSGLKFYPTSASTNLSLTVVKYPRLILAADGADACELPDYQMYSIIGLAIKLAGVSIRDQEILEDVRLAGLQITQ